MELQRSFLFAQCAAASPSKLCQACTSDPENAMTNNTRIDFIYLSEQDMIRAGVTDMLACVNTMEEVFDLLYNCLLYTSPSPRDS